MRRPLSSPIPASPTLLVALAAALALGGTGARAADADDGLEAGTIATSVASCLDRSVVPCTDFYRFACGGWLKTEKLPEGRELWRRGPDGIEDRNLATLREILEEAAAGSSTDAGAAQAGMFYASCMDEATIDPRGPGPLRPMLRQIASIRDAAMLMRVVGGMHRVGLDALWSIDIRPGPGDGDRNTLHIEPGGMGLPDAPGYLAESAADQELRTLYRRHIAGMLETMGEGAEMLQERAAGVLDLETALARAAVERDSSTARPTLDRKELQELTPELPWDVYFAALRAPTVEQVAVVVPEVFPVVTNLVEKDDFATLRAYLRWRMIRSTAHLLSSELVQSDFELFGRRLGGQEELAPRWQRCVQATDAALPDTLGRLFVERRFAGHSLGLATDLAKEIETALVARLEKLSWMTGDTRKVVLQRIRNLANQIGHPVPWRDESALKLSRDHFLENVLSARMIRIQHLLGEIGKPVDREAWTGSIALGHVAYVATGNRLLAPAASLQPPWFHRDLPAAMNFGGIGGLVGREGIRPLQDLVPDAAQDDAQIRCLTEAQATGDTTALAELAAEIGGLRLAYQAWQRWNRTREESPLPGLELDPDQLFFVAFAQTWCTLEASGDAEPGILAAQARVNGTLSNLPAFAEAFECTTEEAMGSDTVCEFW